MTTPAPLYYPTDNPAGLPPLGVVVFIVWDDRPEFLAARVKDPREGRRGRTCWLTNDKGKPVMLPLLEYKAPDPKRPYAGWHTLKDAGPSRWRPQFPERWAAPLPEPLPQGLASQAGLMWSSTMRFQAVEDAEAAELAGEMERDRQAARARGEEPDAAELPEKQWWLDPHLVTYSAPGAIGQREAEGRLMRAFLTERWVRVERPSTNTFGQILGRLAKSVPAKEAATDDPRPLLPEPNGRDQDDMTTALGWWLAVAESDWRAGDILRMRAEVPAKSWRSIGKAVRLSHEAARRLHAWALGELTREANGEETVGGALVRERLARVQAGNAAARLQE